MSGFSLIRQRDSMDCGPACLMMICRHYDAHLSTEQVRQQAAKTRAGTTMLGLSRAADALGFRSQALRIDYREWQKKAHLPC